jgi:hypothetical protein
MRAPHDGIVDASLKDVDVWAHEVAVRAMRLPLLSNACGRINSHYEKFRRPPKRAQAHSRFENSTGKKAD